MHFDEILKTTFYGIKNSYSDSDFRLNDAISSDGFLKIDVYSVDRIQHIGKYILSKDTLSETPLEIDIKKGDYVIVYSDGRIYFKRFW